MKRLDAIVEAASHEENITKLRNLVKAARSLCKEWIALYSKEQIETLERIRKLEAENAFREFNKMGSEIFEDGEPRL